MNATLPLVSGPVLINPFRSSCGGRLSFWDLFVSFVGYLSYFEVFVCSVGFNVFPVFWENVDLVPVLRVCSSN